MMENGKRLTSISSGHRVLVSVSYLRVSGRRSAQDASPLSPASTFFSVLRRHSLFDRRSGKHLAKLVMMRCT
jgi:hypothetical protein